MHTKFSSSNFKRTRQLVDLMPYMGGKYKMARGCEDTDRIQIADDRL